MSSRYRLGAPIGEGGMGVVLAARDEREGRDVAVKLLQVIGEQNIERFLREAKLSMKIESSHVVRVLDVGQLDGNPFFVMERLDGEDFGHKVRQGELGLTEVANCILQTCEALAHAHGAGIVHRDIKASNLFEHRRPDGSTLVKVLDFGISKSIATNPTEVERTLTRTRDGGFLGSPPYMSPEHVKDPRNVDGRADLWSLGVAAYRLLSTQFPFPGETTGEVLAAILEGKPKRLRQLGIEVPEAIDEIIIDRLLARDRADRYGDAGLVARAFAPYASSKWRHYGESVPQIVARGAVPPPIETSRKRKPIAEPRTATVPPPVPEDPATVADDELALAMAPTVTATLADITGPRVPTVDPPTPPTPLPSAWPPAASSRAVFAIAPVPPPAPKSSSSAALVIGLLACVLLAAGGATAFVLRHRVASPPPSPAIATAVEAAPPPASAAVVELPATPAVPASAPAPADSHLTSRTRKPLARPAVRPAAPAPAPTPKSELEKNPYGQ